MTKITKALSLIMAALLLTAFVTGCGSDDHSGPSHQHEHQH